MKKHWIKKGLIFKPNGEFGIGFTHCHKPTPLILDETIIRLYFGIRDNYNKTKTAFIDLDRKNLNDIKYIHPKPVLDLGNIGTFDDSGAQVCSVIRVNNEIYMYYIGWNTSTTVPSRNSLGLAVSRDNGLTFNRLYEGPILERLKNEPYHVGAADVLYENGEWKMWYNSGNGYKIINGKPEYTLQIKYATSKNGIDWKREDIICIKPNSESEIIGRPSVIRTDTGYKMWYSRREIANFRSDSNASYRVGYAESLNGIDWLRMDDDKGIDISSNIGDWDSKMIAYPYIIQEQDRLIMFYNGNGFGKSGVGFATIEI
ncbi:MAG: hypothetical protein JXP36_20420 [Bacteroidales bacterium]|nr:hypothetical protein [Bacteroidales bacterium]